MFNMAVLLHKIANLKLQSCSYWVPWDRHRVYGNCIQ